MSQYTILIGTTVTPNMVIDPFFLAIVKDMPFDADYADTTEPLTLYALTTSNHPPTGLALLQTYCPIKLDIIHVIHTRSQTEILERTLQIKFQHRRLHSFWYAFSPDDIQFIQALNETNFSSMIGFIQRQLKKPDMSEAQLQQLINEQLEKASNALWEKPNYK